MVQTNLTLKEQASAGQAFSASNTRAEMDNIAAAFVPFVDAIRIISSGKQQSVTLGKDAKGKPITITRDALAKTDRRLAMLISESAASAFYDEGSAGSVVPKAPGAAASGFALFIKLGAQCLNPLGEEAAVFFGYPSPNESCSKFQDFKSQVKEGLVDAWGIAMQKTATNVSRTMSRIGAAAVLLTPLAGEEAVTELLVDVAARAGVAKTLAKAYQEFTKVTTDYSPEDRQSMLDNARDGIDAGTSDSINEGMADQIDSRFQDLVAHTASDDPLLTKLLDLQDKELSLLEKLRDQPAQTALIQVRNPDGSYSLVSDVLPGPVNTVSGKMLDSANAPVAEGYVEFGNGSQLQTPYAMAAINADGTFQLPVPANQVGKTIPSTVALQFNLPNAGGPGYIAYSGPSVGIGQSNLTLSPLRFGSSGGCGTNGSVCLAD